MSPRVAYLAAAGVGFFALSWEILWYRVVSFATGGAPISFGVLLGAYLLGIAIGSAAARRLCPDEVDAVRGRRVAAGLMLVSSLAAFLVVPGLTHLVRWLPWPFILPLVALATTLSGALLPLICHQAIRPDGSAGAALGRIYLASIVGSALGSLVTGFVLLDLLPFASIASLLLVGGLLLVLLLHPAPSTRGPLLMIGSGTLAALLLAPPLHADMWARLLHGDEFEGAPALSRIVENRQGVIAISEDGRVYGGGIYDGVISTSLVDDRNWIVRPFTLAGIDRAPEEVLVVGLSMGAWTQVVANLPSVKRVTVLEINPGYLSLIPHYPEVAGLLRDPRIEIVVDDGRRWLQRHPARRFDLIVQNTTWHWRAHCTNLVSREYFELVRSRLRPRGCFLVNTTFSDDIKRTALHVFRHGMRVVNCMLVSDAPIHLARDRWSRVLRAMRIDGAPVFDLTRAVHRARLEEVLSLADGLDGPYRLQALESGSRLRERLGPTPIVTDDNMRTEFRR